MICSVFLSFLRLLSCPAAAKTNNSLTATQHLELSRSGGEDEDEIIHIQSPPPPLSALSERTEKNGVNFSCRRRFV